MDHPAVPATISSQRERLIVIVVLAVFILLAVGFSLGPIFEGPDELEHYRFVRELAETRALPDPRQPHEEYHQPPLYYVLAALIKAPINDADFEQVEVNPYHLYHNHGEKFIAGNDNKNHLIHPQSESFPFIQSGTALAVHLIRLLSVACGACSILMCYFIFSMLWPNRSDLRLFSLAIGACWPLMLYMSSTVSNDALTILLSCLSLLLVLRQVRHGPSLLSAMIMGLVLGLALLTKVSSLLLAIPVGVAVAIDLRHTWKHALVTLTLTIAIAGWWYARNMLLYGQVSAMYSSWPALEVQAGQLAFSDGLGRLSFVYQRLWARLGANSIVVAPAIYRFFDVLTALGLVGAVVQFARRWRIRHEKPWAHSIPREIVVMTAFAIALLAAIVYYTYTNWAGNQGRFLLPGVAIWSALLAVGLEVWVPRSIRLPATFCFMGIMASVAAACLFGYYLPAYRPLTAPTQLEHPLAFRYGEAAELIGIDPDLTRARPGEMVRITLIWRAIQPTDTRLQVYLHSTDPDGRLVRRDSLPATGNLLSTEWLPGQTWAEEYVIPIPADTEEQAAYPLIAGLYDPQAAQTLQAFDASGSEVTPIVGRIAVIGPSQPFTSAYRFGEIIGLAEPQIDEDGDSVKVCLRWLSVAPASLDYHVFVHLLDAGGSQIAQADFQPKNGLYPTSVWNPGETVDDCVMLKASELPGSGWQVAVGLYDLATGQRLSVVDAAGQSLSNDRVLIQP